MDEANLLADERGIPWRLPKDTAHFRRYTQGKWLLLGRHTFVEMRGWFTDHTPLVLSSACGYDPEIGRVVASVPQALAQAEAAEQEELVCCGGAQTYAAALPYADQLVLTQIHHHFEPLSHAVYFPKWNPDEWQLLDRTELSQDAENAWNMSVFTLMRKAQT
ncbi:dihydrofolate reductase [soil metagenome]